MRILVTPVIADIKRAHVNKAIKMREITAHYYGVSQVSSIMKKFIAVLIASFFVFSSVAEARGFAARGFSARSFSRPARVVTPNTAPTKNTVVVNKKTTVNNTQQESSSGSVSNFVSDVASTAAGVAIGAAVYDSMSSDQNEEVKQK